MTTGDTAYYIDSADLPDIRDLAGLTVRVEARGHLPADFTFSLTTAGTGYRIAPSTITVRLRAASAWLTLLLMLPALIGLPISVLAIHRPRWWPLPNGAENAAFVYSYGGAITWGLTAAGLTLGFLFWGQSSIPLYWPALFIPSGLIVASVLGSFAYSAFVVLDKDEAFFESSNRLSNLRVLGGRLWIAPYVAVVVWLPLSSANATFATSTWAAVIGFLCGLYIKVALSFLNALGTRLLSKEEAERVASRAQAGVVSQLSPDQQTGQATPAPPTQAFLDAVNRARQELIRKPNVIAVGPGSKIADKTNTAVPAIVTYVLKKDPATADTVPKTFEGFLTDVQVLPEPAGNECYGVGLLIDPSKVEEEATKRKQPAPASSSARLVDGTQVILLPGQLEEFLVMEGAVRVLNLISCVRAVEHLLPPGVQFISFVWDPAAGEPALGNYSGKVRRPRFGATSNLPEHNFGPASLLSCQVLSNTVDIRRVLHEIGHTWCAYVSLRENILLKAAEIIGPSDPQSFYHWRDLFACGSSPVRNFENEWKIQPDGRYKEEEVLFGEWRYSPTDLYLMGLAPRPQDPLPILRRESAPYAVKVTDISPQELPQVDMMPTPAAFQHVFVVVTTNETRGAALASDFVDKLRKRVARHFANATGGKASLMTEIRLPS